MNEIFDTDFGRQPMTLRSLSSFHPSIKSQSNSDDYKNKERYTLVWICTGFNEGLEGKRSGMVLAQGCPVYSWPNENTVKTTASWRIIKGFILSLHGIESIVAVTKKEYTGS